MRQRRLFCAMQIGEEQEAYILEPDGVPVAPLEELVVGGEPAADDDAALDETEQVVPT